MRNLKMRLFFLIILCLNFSTGFAENNNNSANNKTREIAPIGSHIGQHTPDFTLKDLNGKSYRLKDYENKNVVLLDVWATWCGPCRQYMPETQSYYTEFSNTSLKVLAVNIEGDTDKVKQFIHSFNFTFTVLLDSGNWDALTVQLFKIDSIPRYIFIDKNGIIRFNGHPGDISKKIIKQYL